MGLATAALVKKILMIVFLENERGVHCTECAERMAVQLGINKADIKVYGPVWYREELGENFNYDV